MNKERLSQLFKFLEEEPEDPFTIYAIALEYQKSDLNEALKYFENLLENHEDYLGTYYHAANVYALLGQNEKAETTYKKGLQIAQLQGDRHAHRELQNAYNEFLFDDE